MFDVTKWFPDPQGYIVFDTVEHFAYHLAKLLDIEVGDHVSASENLFDEWGLDSLQAFQVIIIVETMANVMVPPATIPEMYTVGDVYGYYRSMVGLEVR